MPAALGLLAATLPFARASHEHSTNHAIQPNLPEARAVRNRMYAQNVTVRIEHAQSARALGRLRSSKNVLNLASADEALPQSAGSGSELQDDVPIVFAVLTGKEHHNDRAAAAKQTWCAGINACIFFSDAPSATLPTISISFDGLPSLTEYERAQLRYLPVLDYMRELMTSGRDMKFGKTKWSAPTRATGLARILPPGLLASRALSPAEVEGTHLPCTNRVMMLFYWHTGWCWSTTTPSCSTATWPATLLHWTRPLPFTRATSFQKPGYPLTETAVAT